MPMKPETILGLGGKFMESRIFLTAAELDVFTLLMKKPMSPREIADINGLKIVFTFRACSA